MAHERIFPRGQGLKPLDLEENSLPVQRSLGMSWDLDKDQFQFDVRLGDTPGTRRGMLSALNSVFDPMGFLSPFTIQGRILLRELTAGTGWDDPVPEDHLWRWDEWKASIGKLDTFGIPRMFMPTSVSTAENVELHVFADASEKAIAAVGYVRVVTGDSAHVGFAMGKARLAPTQGHTIPRLELCAAVLAVEVGATLSETLNIPLDKIRYYSDSKVVLGYVSNRTRRFYTYVSNRVQKVLQTSKPEQWSYIPTHENPADQATRASMTADKFGASLRLMDPQRLRRPLCETPSEDYPLIAPDGDSEVRPAVVSVMKSKIDQTGQHRTFVSRFEGFSQWKKLVSVIALIKRVAKGRKPKNSDQDELYKYGKSSPEAETFVIKAVQQEFYGDEIKSLSDGKPIPRNSSVLALSPFLDEKGLRVGGRLQKSELSTKEKNPILIPGGHHIAVLLTRHFHASVQHQGRHFTEGAIRAAGFWITGGKRLVSDVIHLCVKCRKLRGGLCHQKMADLPSDRLTPSPPFSYVGVDVFGPWNITTRRTRGGSAASKRWAVMFTCLTTRAIHIEVIEEMSSSSFINAVRRFYSVRGKVTEFRSDRGTNFVGATKDLGITAINVEEDSVKEFLRDSGAIWRFNPPHASHFGGVWERMIGVARRILNSMLLETRKGLTHEVLSTLMAEVCAIVNARPLVPVSSDAEAPFILSPSILLTKKTGSPVESFIQLNVKEMYHAQWKHVQVLDNQFWNRWKREYLATIQSRRKWPCATPNVKEGDVVLMRDNQVARNDWPMGIITRTFPSDDRLIRKVQVLICRDGTSSKFVRSVSEITVLVPKD